jgi:hypothetical protein
MLKLSQNPTGSTLFATLNHAPDDNGIEGLLAGEIVVPGGPVTITEAARRVFEAARGQGDLFLRGGRVTRYDSAADRLEALTPAAARGYLERYTGRTFAVSMGRTGEPVIRPKPFSEADAKAILAAPVASDILPRVEALSRVPVLMANGETLNPGLHPAHGVFVTGGIKVEDPASVADARKYLLDLLSEFDFATPSDMSRALGMILTPALKDGGWIRGHIPIDVAEAEESQSGKGYRQQITAAIYGCALSPIAKASGGVGGFDEAIQQALVHGARFVQLDNLRGRVDSQMLEAMKTAQGAFNCRVPHVGYVTVNISGVLFMLSSNGAEMTRDLANRACVVRIRKKPPGYAFKRNPLDEVHNNPGRALGAVFCCIREWARHGAERLTTGDHDFREWAAVVGGIIEFLGLPPLLEGHRKAQDRTANPFLSWLRKVCVIMAAEDRLGGEHHLTELVRLGMDHDELPPVPNPNKEPEDLARPLGRRMGALFADSNLADLEGYTLEKVQRVKEYAGTGPKVETLYIVRK